jgi:hypothetical protein
MAGYQREKNQARAHLPGCTGLGKRFPRVVGAFGVHVRGDCAQQAVGGRLGKNHDEVDWLERGHQLGPFSFGHDRPARFVDGAVGIDADDEQIALVASLAQVAQMANVQQVKDAVGEDDACPALARVGQPGFERCQIEHRPGHIPY